MDAVELLGQLAGRWAGDNALWLDPSQPEPYTSPTTAEVTLVALDRFARLDYTWAIDGEAQAGSILVGGDEASGAVTAVWIDPWHNARRMMVCHGHVSQDGPGAEGGTVSVRGSYPAPPGPDWGWGIDIGPGDDGTLRLIMFNIPPGGEPELAVEAIYRRSG